MKKALLLLVIFVSTFLVACKSSYTIKVQHAAKLTFPTDVTKVLIINRTDTEKGTKAGKILEGVLTGEVPMADQFGAQNCSDGIVSLLNQSQRLDVVGPLLKMKHNDGLGTPSQLSWDLVDSLANKHGADIVVVLEFFDSDQPGAVAGQNIPGAYNGNNVWIDAVWRIYDPEEQKIVDQFNQRFRSYNNGYNPVFIGTRNINNSAYHAGMDYGRSIVPSWYWENRTLYDAGSKGIKTGARMAKAGNWKAAEELWTKELASASKPKVIHRLYLNLAVANEMKGDFQRSLDYAQKAYALKAKRWIANYTNILQTRMGEQLLIEQQLEREDN